LTLTGQSASALPAKPARQIFVASIRWIPRAASSLLKAKLLRGLSGRRGGS
jgi:hypothetical protein